MIIKLIIMQNVKSKELAHSDKDDDSLYGEFHEQGKIYFHKTKTCKI